MSKYTALVNVNHVFKYGNCCTSIVFKKKKKSQIFEKENCHCLLFNLCRYKMCLSVTHSSVLHTSHFIHTSDTEQ